MLATNSLHAAIALARAAVLTASAPVRVRLPATKPLPTSPAPSRPSCSADALRAGLDLTPGAVRLHDLVVQLAGDVAAVRGYRALPSRVVFHVPAILLAAALGYTDRHVRRLAAELERAGLLAYGGHAARVKGRNLWDGTLYCVRMAENAPAPRIRHDEWRHVWRDFEGDLSAGRTAKSDVLTHQQKWEGIYDRLKAWAVGRRSSTSPVESRKDIAPREVVYALPALLDAHPRQRADLITSYAHALAHGLRDEHSRRLYAGLLHQAVTAEHRGVRALAALQNALQRVMVDTAEWSELRRPGALLIARLRECGVWQKVRFAALKNE